MTTIVRKDIGRFSLFDLFGMLAVDQLSVQERSDILNYLKEDGFSENLIIQNIDRVKNNSILLFPQDSQQSLQAQQRAVRTRPACHIVTQSPDHTE